MALSPIIIELTKLGMKFPRDPATQPIDSHVIYENMCRQSMTASFSWRRWSKT